MNGLTQRSGLIFQVPVDRLPAGSFPGFFQRTDQEKRLSDRLAHRRRKGGRLDGAGGSPGHGFSLRLLCFGAVPALFPPYRPEIGRAIPAPTPGDGGREEQAFGNRPEEALPRAAGSDQGGGASRTS